MSETRRCTKKVSKKIIGLKYFYMNRHRCIIQFYKEVKKYPQPERAVMPSPALHTTQAVDKTSSFFELNSATMEEYNRDV